ncbi:hypothetical protein ADEAN_001030100 [Angomonas deanei]|uniref:Uncharacterized protein n=1 Tax=Angomonas deanei TaxID=59799 RepID=A0A7G2CUZ6_9TRYP|nr:hypothetical protein ADEAN_001030100 [Angomonas deanei]
MPSTSLFDLFLSAIDALNPSEIPARKAVQQQITDSTNSLLQNFLNTALRSEAALPAGLAETETPFPFHELIPAGDFTAVEESVGQHFPDALAAAITGANLPSSTTLAERRVALFRALPKSYRVVLLVTAVWLSLKFWAASLQRVTLTALFFSMQDQLVQDRRQSAPRESAPTEVQSDALLWAPAEDDFHHSGETAVNALCTATEEAEIVLLRGSNYCVPFLS